MNSGQLKVLFVVVVSAFFAVYLGFAAATESVTALLWVGGLLLLVLVLGLGPHVWILIPATLVLQGNLNLLPGAPPAWALATVIVAFMYAIRFATRRHNFVFRWNWLDLAILLQIVAVAQAWIRNPTGLLILGGATAGGKPYFVFALVGLAYACLSVTLPTAKAIRWAVYSAIVVGLADGAVLILNDFSPKFAQACLRIYGGNVGAALSGQTLDIEEARGGFGMGILGRNLLLPLFCLLPTIRCINPLRVWSFALTGAASVMILLSGFRSGVAYFAVLFASAAVARRRWIDIELAAGVGTLALAAVLGSGNLDKLPYGVQRVFSAVGGKVRADVRRDAEDSTNVRFEVWKTVLTEDGYIRNKWLGDGFSITAREQTAIMARSIQGIATQMGLDDFKSWCLATGAYHGFHVETIRFTGYFGLACAVFAMIVFFKCGLRLVRHFRGQPLFGPVLYVCLPIMIYLFWSLLVFGSYRVDYPPILIMAGMMKMLDNLRLRQLAEENAAEAGKAV
jgi:hypothetical protein